MGNGEVTSPLEDPLEKSSWELLDLPAWGIYQLLFLDSTQFLDSALKQAEFVKMEKDQEWIQVLWRLKDDFYKKYNANLWTQN